MTKLSIAPTSFAASLILPLILFATPVLAASEHKVAEPSEALFAFW